MFVFASLDNEMDSRFADILKLVNTQQENSCSSRIWIELKNKGGSCWSGLIMASGTDCVELVGSSDRPECQETGEVLTPVSCQSCEGNSSIGKLNRKRQVKTNSRAPLEKDEGFCFIFI